MNEQVTWVSTDIEATRNGWYIINYEITDATGKEYFQRLKCDTKTGAKQAIKEMKRGMKNALRTIL